MEMLKGGQSKFCKRGIKICTSYSKKWFVNIEKIQAFGLICIYVYFSLVGKVFVAIEFALKDKKYKKQFEREVTKMNRQIPVYVNESILMEFHNKCV